MYATALLSQLPGTVISVVACIVAVLAIKGPGRWLALVGIVLAMVSGFMVIGLVNLDRPLRTVVLVLNALTGVLSYALLAAAVVVGRFWSRRQQQVTSG